MQIHEILDRMELLDPTNTFFTDLRKIILNDDKFALFRLIQDQNKSQLIEGLRKYKDDDSFKSDCFSRGQLESKLWLIKELNKCDIKLGTAKFENAHFITKDLSICNIFFEVDDKY